MKTRPVIDRVLFVGGSLQFASVKMRCQEVAEAIGAAWTTPDKPGAQWQGGRVPDSELEGRDLFVLVKAQVDRQELHRRGRIIWDVLDDAPPRSHIDAYLTSTEYAARLFGPFASTHVIPQHHCNSARRIVTPDRVRGRLLWIGSQRWLPEDLEEQGVDIEVVVGGLSDEDAYRLYSRADLIVNARRFDARIPAIHLLHTQLNAGVKVINAVGFGLPSVSEWEPWVDEIAPGCTVVCAPGDSARTAYALLRDPRRYDAVRANCLRAAETYALPSIAARYVPMLEAVAASPRAAAAPVRTAAAADEPYPMEVVTLLRRAGRQI